MWHVYWYINLCSHAHWIGYLRKKCKPREDGLLRDTLYAILVLTYDWHTHLNSGRVQIKGQIRKLSLCFSILSRSISDHYSSSEWVAKFEISRKNMKEEYRWAIEHTVKSVLKLIFIKQSHVFKGWGFRSCKWKISETCIKSAPLLSNNSLV